MSTNVSLGGTAATDWHSVQEIRNMLVLLHVTGIKHHPVKPHGPLNP